MSLLVPPIGWRPPAFEASFLTTDGDTVDRSIYTFFDLLFGAAHATRRLLVSIHSNFSAGRTLQSVSIGGVAATIHFNPDPTGGVGVAWASALIPTGATGNLVVTFDATALRCVFGLYRLVHARDSAPFDTDGTTSTSGSLSVDVPKGGAVFGAQTASQGVSGTPSGITQTFNNNYEFANWRARGGMATSLAEQTLAVTLAAPANSNVSAAISWR